MSDTRDPILAAADRAFGKPKLFCAFCGKSQHDAWKLIAGPNVFICDECTDLCSVIIMEDPMTAAQHLTSLEHIRLGELKLTAQEALGKALEAQGPSNEMTVGQLLSALGQVIYSEGVKQQLINDKHPPPVPRK